MTSNPLCRAMTDLRIARETIGDPDLLRLIDGISGLLNSRPSSSDLAEAFHESGDVMAPGKSGQSTIADVTTRRTSEPMTVDFIRLVRKQHRYDLTALCSAISADWQSSDAVATQLLLLYVDSASWQELHSFLQHNPERTFSLSAEDLGKIVLALLATDSRSTEIWPNEHLPFAAKTGFVNAIGSIMLQQHSLINALLGAVENLPPPRT